MEASLLPGLSAEEIALAQAQGRRLAEVAMRLAGAR